MLNSKRELIWFRFEIAESFDVSVEFLCDYK